MSTTATMSDTLPGGAKPNAAGNSPGLSLESLKSLLGGNSLVPLIIVVAAFIALSVAAFLWATAPTYQVLYSNLSEADGGTIIAELDKRTIPYKFSEGGHAILVPSDQVHTLRLQLAEQGLPKGGKVGFDLMDKQAFGISQFAEQINFQRGLEGELARSMESLGPVANARIHLAMAKPSVFIKQRAPSKASVVLTLHPGRTLSEGQVNAIIHMVSSSVPELSVENVSIVDQHGTLLSKPGSAASDLDGTHLKYTQDVETSYQERISHILTPLFGSDNFRVQVTAEIDFSTIEETNEAYAPNQDPAKSAVRSAQTSTQYSGEDALSGGVPGALSNTAPNTRPSPVEATEDGAQGAESTGESGKSGSVSKDSIINYEVDRNITHIKHQRGMTKRLSVAVVLNYRIGLDEDGKPEPQPLEEAEIEQVTLLVKQAVGYSSERGDQVEIVNSPFSPEQEEIFEEIPWWKTPQFMDLLFSGLRYFFVGLFILLVYLFIVRPMLKRHLSIQLVPGGVAKGGTTRAVVGDDDDDLEQVEDEDGQPTFKRKNKAASYSQQLNELKSMAKEDPRLIAIIVKAWMADHD